MRLRWLEIERDTGPSILWWSMMGWGIGIAVYWNHGWFLGFISSMLSIGLIYFAIQLITSSRIPAEARHLANEAVASFETAYPDDQITSVALRAVEAERYIYSVRYKTPGQISFPEARRYFAVSRNSTRHVTELDIAEWWPRGLK